MEFSPIAIVGRSCLLPGALTPAQLWQAVAGGRDLLGSAPPGRWRLPREAVVCAPDGASGDHAWSDRGGYVEGFESVWNPQDFAVPAEELADLDPLVHWVLHSAREALRESHRDDGARIGAIFGNLGFPSEGMAEFARSVWMGQVSAAHPFRPDPVEGRGPGARVSTGSARTAPAIDLRNRYMSAGTADILRRALNLDADAFCIDAACASSLYAIKLACDRLHEGSADVMLAGAVQRADDLFLHVGFCALNALSRSGQSRPFHRDADGLIPAEGAAFVALKRLADARRDGDTIYGVIRGIGLSNDGRGKGLLAPAEEGQQRALRAAYASAGFGPERVSLLECHATGTPVGDATELRSSAAVFAGCNALPVGSLKSNLGHLITTAGAAGLIKLTEAMRAAQRPPTLHIETPTAALQETPFRLLRELEDWDSDGPRIAAISAFGFGGNNAHLIVSEDSPDLLPSPPAAVPSPRARGEGGRRPDEGCPQVATDSNAEAQQIAIVALGCIVASADNRARFTDALFSDSKLLDANGEGRMSDLQLDLEGLKFPPRDLAQTLAQQLAVLQASREALAETTPLPRERSGIYIGMEPDPEVARYGVRWRLADGIDDDQRLRQARDAVVAVLESAAVVGTMPNIPANRLSSQFDLGGPAFTVQAGAASGPIAVQLAARALRLRELDAAVVGAVDLCCEAVQRAASSDAPGDACVVLVLKRLDDARRDGDRIYALLDAQPIGATSSIESSAAEDAFDGEDLRTRFGNSHAASGMLQVAAAALGLHHRRHRDGRPWLSTGVRRKRVTLSDGTTLSLSEAPDRPRRGEVPVARLHCFAGNDRAAVIDALERRAENCQGAARLVLVARDDDFDTLRTHALAHLRNGAPAGSGIHFFEHPLRGEVAFVFAGAGASYQGMGRDLLIQLPQLVDALAARSARLATALAWSFEATERQPTAIEQLWGASALSQLHLELTRGVLGLKADAWLGYSSGETNALVAAGVWTDPDALMAEMEASGLMTRELGGSFDAIARQWNTRVDWASWTVLAPLAEVRAALLGLQRVHIAIINSDEECLIGGDAASCATVVERIGRNRCLQLIYPLAVHVPELSQVAAQWLQLHRRSTAPLSGSRIYSNASGRSYVPSEENCARAILEQANQTLDLRPAVLAAWNDGVRIFVEHGPGNTYGRAIRNILGEREALVVSLDRRGQGIESVLNAVAALLAAGVELNHQALADLLLPAKPLKPGSRVQSFAAHPPVIDPVAAFLRPPSAPLLPAGGEKVAADRMRGAAQPRETATEAAQIMQPAPRLPSVLDAPPEPQRAASIAAASDGDSVRIALATRTTTLPVAKPAANVSPPAAHYLAHLEQLSQLQQDFARDQQRVHQQFLMLRADALRSLMQAGARGGAAPGSAAGPSKLQPPASTVAAALAVSVRAPLVASTTQEAPQATVEPRLRVAAPPAAAASAAMTAWSQPSGPVFSREQLEVHSDGPISQIYGPLFAPQDQYRRQVRMPRPPLLLADRVTGLSAEPASMGKGTIWTETDVSWDSWYLHRGYMPAGVMIEAGQADLMLISYLGVDLLNRGERVYRLLGCELTYHGDLPRAGDTLRFSIHLDGHAAQGDVRLMFFHYDCRNGERAQLSVRKGQAGFFTDAELAASAGCLWTAEEQAIVAEPRLDPAVALSAHRRFDKARLQAFAEGDTFACFGAGFERAQTHTRSPAIQQGQMLLLDRVTQLDSGGGPWKRGYLRAELDIRADQWFFDGHFKNDPCMPGTLMFEGCLQALAFYLAAHGHSIERDGWRFQPVPELPYQLQCRGQVIPGSRLLVTEVFVEEIVAGPLPTVYADLLCTVDGLKAFHARRVALQLVPDWPLQGMPAQLHEAVPDAHPVAIVDGFRFDHRSLLACALGKPSDAFGPMYRRFDGPMRVARLPCPPYHFMSRIRSIDGPIGVMKAGTRAVVEYDVPNDVWYFDQNGCRTMPFAVLLEAALQPCGWLSSFVGSALTVESELGFRNLDGRGTLLAELHDDCGTLTTEVELLEVSAASAMIIESFAVRCYLGAREVYRLRTVFGFFPPAALAAQAGLPTNDGHRELLRRECDFALDLEPKPTDFFAAGRPRLAASMLLMIDRIEGYWPDAGAAGLGQLRAAKDVDADEWFFKAHFFQDPVQPGSLGIEAMIQTLQFYMLHTRMDDGIENPRFESLAVDREHQWKYRGQVLPHHRIVHTTMEITASGRDERGAFAVATASLWADGQRIYEAIGLAVRIVPDHRMQERFK